MEVDWTQVSSQVIRALRGKVSQLAASRRLGFSANPVREWEAGRRHPTAAQAFALAHAMDADVVGVFGSFHKASAVEIGKPEALDQETLAAWLSSLRGADTIKAIESKCSLSRFSISRMLKGQSSLRFPEFLELVHAITARADSFIAELVSIDEVPALPIDYSSVALREVGFEYPWLHGILRLMDTEEYNEAGSYEEGWFSKRLRISLAEETTIITRMLEKGLLSKDNGKLVAHMPKNLYMGSRPEEAIRNKRHYTRVVEKRLNDGLGASDYVVSNIISISKKDYERIKDLMQTTAREVQAIVRKTKSEEVAAVIGLHTVQFGIEEEREGPVGENGPRSES